MSDPQNEILVKYINKYGMTCLLHTLLIIINKYKTNGPNLEYINKLYSDLFDTYTNYLLRNEAEDKDATL
jgi:hypothetical protein